MQIREIGTRFEGIVVIINNNKNHEKHSPKYHVMPKKDPGVRILIINSDGGSSHHKSEVLRRTFHMGVGRGVEIRILYSVVYFCDPMS